MESESRYVVGKMVGTTFPLQIFQEMKEILKSRGGSWCESTELHLKYFHEIFEFICFLWCCPGSIYIF